jgi:ABC-2 type transport system permease protein
MKLKMKKPEFNRRRMKHGSYSLMLSAVVIAGAVVVNLIANELPSQFTKIDLSSNQLSVLTDTTKELLSSLTDDITIYYLTQDSSADSNVSRLLDRYNDYSSHVTVIQKDPVLYPKFASQYTDETISENSVIITCGDQSRVISYDDMYESEFDYSYFSYQTTGFDAEGQITSAISALSSDELPKLYTLTGHNELSLSDTMTASVEKENIETETLNLVSAEAVPDDADALLIYSPTQDLSDAETTKILNYLRRGGKAIIITDYTGDELPNLASVLSYYGVSIVDGIVMESNSNYYVQLPYYLLPEINNTDVSSDLTDGAGYVLLATAQGLQETDDARDTLTITEVLSTSSSSYSKTDVENMTTYAQESDDISGPFAVGVTITEDVELTEELLADTAEVTDDATLDGTLGSLTLTDAEEESEAEDTEDDTENSETEDAAMTGELSEVAEEETDADNSTAEETETATTRLAVFTSSSLLNESADQMVSGGNSRLFLNTLSWICGSTASVSVPVKSLTTSYLTVPSSSGNLWSIIVIGVIPGLILIYGLYIWLKRRKQ